MIDSHTIVIVTARTIEQLTLARQALKALAADDDQETDVENLRISIENIERDLIAWSAKACQQVEARRPRRGSRTAPVADLVHRASTRDLRITLCGRNLSGLSYVNLGPGSTEEGSPNCPACVEQWGYVLRATGKLEDGVTGIETVAEALALLAPVADAQAHLRDLRELYVKDLREAEPKRQWMVVEALADLLRSMVADETLTEGACIAALHAWDTEWLRGKDLLAKDPQPPSHNAA